MSRAFVFFSIFGLLTAILLFLFGPPIKEELRYQFDQWSKISYSLEANPEFPESSIRPVTPFDKEFGIVIPKINANVSIFSQIDPASPAAYLAILKAGIAQAKGSTYPDKEGNVVLFAQASYDFAGLTTPQIFDLIYNLGRSNAVFFLTDRLEKDDEIDLFYENRRYEYTVVEKAFVSPERLTDYIKEQTESNDGKILILETGYPPGMAFQRLVIIAKQLEKKE